MDGIKAIWEIYWPSGALYNLAMSGSSFLVLWVSRLRVGRFAALHELRTFLEALAGVYIIIAAGVPLSITTAAVFPMASGFANIIGALFMGLLYILPPAVVFILQHTKLKPAALGVQCENCFQFVHFSNWICGHCKGENDNCFVNRCRSCGYKSGTMICPHCLTAFVVNKRRPRLPSAIIAPPPPLPYEQQEAQLQWQLECLEREKKIADMRNQVKAKQAEVKRMNESLGLSRFQQMQSEIEAQIEQELAKNLEEKLVFSRMREKKRKEYENDPTLLRDALTVLDSLEERNKADRMRRTGAR